MGASKRYKNKTCSYCGRPKCSTTNDHVIARSFFLDEQRDQDLCIPQVPACDDCNNKKSALENYIGSSLLIGSQIAQGDDYRKTKVSGRLLKNRRLSKELELAAQPKWYSINGVWQQMHAIKVNPSKITELLGMIVKGLYAFHYGEPLPWGFEPDVSMFKPEVEVGMWAQLSSYFPPEAVRINRDLGHGVFTYTCAQSPAHKGLTVWILGFHGMIRLHGEGGSADHWWCVTRPTEELLSSLPSEASDATHADAER